MAKVSPRTAPFIEMVKDEGLEVVDIVQNKHFKFTVRRRDGRTRKFSVSTSSSDRRAMMNARTLLRRFAEES